MQAIRTKYLPATNRRPSRIKAECKRGSVIIDYPHELSGDAVHRLAVHKLILKFVLEDEKKYGKHKNHWQGEFVTGGLSDGTMAHVYL